MKKKDDQNGMKMVITALAVAGFAYPLLWVVAFVLYEGVVRRGKDVVAVWLQSKRDR